MCDVRRLTLNKKRRKREPMNIKKSLWVVFAAVSECLAQTYNISGIVTDTGTTPISGAVVKLENARLTATSGADGRFTLTNIGVFGKSGGLVVQQPAVTLRKGFIAFDLREPAGLFGFTSIRCRGGSFRGYSEHWVLGGSHCLFLKLGPGFVSIG